MDSTPTLHLVAYSVNQKGRSEPTVLEDIAINEAEKRTGMLSTFYYILQYLFYITLLYPYFYTYMCTLLDFVYYVSASVPLKTIDRG